MRNAGRRVPCTTPPSQTAQAEGVDAELAKALDDSLVGPPGVGHQKVIHGCGVGEATDVAALRLDHARWTAKPCRKLVEVAAGAVDHDCLLGGDCDVLEEGIEVADAATDLHDDHQIGYRPAEFEPERLGESVADVECLHRLSG